MMKRMWGVCGMVVLVFGLWSSSSSVVRAAPQVPCYFIFGDSLVDNGNNNQLQSLARADYLPYGIDFGGPTGRFSNGKTTVDVIGELHLLFFLPSTSAQIFNLLVFSLSLSLFLLSWLSTNLFTQKYGWFFKLNILANA